MMTLKQIEEVAIESAKFLEGPTELDQVGHSAHIDGFLKGAELVAGKADEYAEEYAKALLKYMGFADIEPDQLVNDFNESLKK